MNNDDGGGVGDGGAAIQMKVRRDNKKRDKRR
jgi:hypothetical protein